MIISILGAITEQQKLIESVTIRPHKINSNWFFDSWKKLAGVCSDGYFEFWAKNLQRGVKICL